MIFEDVAIVLRHERLERECPLGTVRDDHECGLATQLIACGRQQQAVKLPGGLTEPQIAPADPFTQPLGERGQLASPHGNRVGAHRGGKRLAAARPGDDKQVRPLVGHDEFQQCRVRVCRGRQFVHPSRRGLAATPAKVGMHRIQIGAERVEFLAATIRQYLLGGLLDEMHFAISPILLGQGESLFEGIDLPARSATE